LSVINYATRGRNSYKVMDRCRRVLAFAQTARKQISEFRDDLLGYRPAGNRCDGKSHLILACAELAKQIASGGVLTAAKQYLLEGKGDPKVLASATFSRIRMSNIRSKKIVENSTSYVGVEAKAQVPTSFMAMLGKETAPVKAYSEVKLGGIKTEIALEFDQTGSMHDLGDDRLSRLQAAARSFIDQLKSINSSSYGLVKTSVVPWSSTVKIEQSWDSKWRIDKSQLAAGDSFKGCIWNRLNDYQPTRKEPKNSAFESP
jgi:hypothetical protein